MVVRCWAVDFMVAHWEVAVCTVADKRACMEQPGKPGSTGARRPTVPRAQAATAQGNAVAFVASENLEKKCTLFRQYVPCGYFIKVLRFVMLICSFISFRKGHFMSL